MPYNAMLAYIISLYIVYTIYFIVSLLLHLQGLQRAYFCTSPTITARRRGPGLMYFSFTPIPLPPNLTTFLQSGKITHALADMARAMISSTILVSVVVVPSSHIKAKRVFDFRTRRPAVSM